MQTIEGLRLNNLCAQGAYSGVYWNDGSFQEISYVTGADSAEMGQGGMRVNMVPQRRRQHVPRHGLRQLRRREVRVRQLRLAGRRAACTRANLAGDLTFNKPNNTLTNVDDVQKIWDVNPSIGGPIVRDKLWFNYTFRHWGADKTMADSFYDDSDPSPFIYVAGPTRPGIDDGHIVSNAARVAWQVDGKDKISVYHDKQRKYRNHWGIAATIPPEASAIQVTPTSFVNVTKWTRTQTNRLLLEAGFGIYDQEYTELYQPEVTGQSDKVWDVDAIRARSPRVYNVLDMRATGKRQRVEQPRRSLLDAADLHGRGVVRDRLARVRGSARAVTQRRLAPDRRSIPATCSRSHSTPARRSSVTLRLPTDRQNGIKATSASSRRTVDDGPRHAEPRPPLRLVHRRDAGERRAASRFNAAQHFGECADGKDDPGRLRRRRCRTGRTSRRASASRWTCSATAARPSRPASRATSPASRSPSPTP